MKEKKTKKQQVTSPECLFWVTFLLSKAQIKEEGWNCDIKKKKESAEDSSFVVLNMFKVGFFCSLFVSPTTLFHSPAASMTITRAWQNYAN